MRTIELRWETGQVLPAWLEDLSVGGALVRVATRPPGDRTVSVCITDAEPPVSVDGTIVAVSKRGGWLRRAWFALRIKFSETCPYDVFRDHLTAWAPPPITLEYESYWR